MGHSERLYWRYCNYAGTQFLTKIAIRDGSRSDINDGVRAYGNQTLKPNNSSANDNYNNYNGCANNNDYDKSPPRLRLTTTWRLRLQRQRKLRQQRKPWQQQRQLQTTVAPTTTVVEKLTTTTGVNLTTTVQPPNNRSANYYSKAIANSTCVTEAPAVTTSAPVVTEAPVVMTSACSNRSSGSDNISNLVVAPEWGASSNNISTCRQKLR